MHLRKRSAAEQKRALESELKQDFAPYYGLLKQFIACKLTKQEFDAQVSKYINNGHRRK
jgi:hypothetical protein